MSKTIKPSSDTSFVKKHTIKWDSSRIILVGFASVILLGTLLLMLPISTREGIVTPFVDALFTATSATCVTGLVVRDTGTYWSSFGQVVILSLIQIGGMGVITAAVTIAIISGRKINLRLRGLMMDSISANHVGGILHLTEFFLKVSLVIELLGGLFLLPVFVPEFGAKGIWMAFFHSVSAFCNAGFDVMGTVESYSSLTHFAGNVHLNIVIMILIVVGGIGFATWNDFRTYKFRLRRYSLQSKLILTVTVFLITLPALYFYFFEFSSGPLAEADPVKRVLLSLFQSITTRTAGFNTADLAQLSENGQLLMIMLMMVGGAPGSTAGGMKVTTLVILLLASQASFRKRELTVYDRRIGDDTVRYAATILMMYLAFSIAGGMCISRIEGLPLLTCLFETASAVGTAGLTLGITTSLGTVSHLILTLLMFTGRIGALTLVYAAMAGSGVQRVRYPEENITVG